MRTRSCRLVTILLPLLVAVLLWPAPTAHAQSVPTTSSPPTSPPKAADCASGRWHATFPLTAP